MDVCRIEVCLEHLWDEMHARACVFSIECWQLRVGRGEVKGTGKERWQEMCWLQEQVVLSVFSLSKRDNDEGVSEVFKEQWDVWIQELTSRAAA